MTLPSHMFHQGTLKGAFCTTNNTGNDLELKIALRKNSLTRVDALNFDLKCKNDNNSIAPSRDILVKILKLLFPIIP